MMNPISTSAVIGLVVGLIAAFGVVLYYLFDFKKRLKKLREEVEIKDAAGRYKLCQQKQTSHGTNTKQGRIGKPKEDLRDGTGTEGPIRPGVMETDTINDNGQDSDSAELHKPTDI